MPNEKDMPDWAKKIENWGDHFWGKKDKDENKNDRGKNNAGYIGAIVVNVILILVFNNLLNWHVPFLTEEFIIPLWVLNVSFGATIFFNLIFLAYDQKWFRTLVQVFLNILSLAVISTLIQIFPFSISANHEHLVKLLLIIMLVAVFIAIIVEIIKLISYTIRFIINIF